MKNYGEIDAVLLNASSITQEQRELVINVLKAHDDFEALAKAVIEQFDGYAVSPLERKWLALAKKAIAVSVLAFVFAMPARAFDRTSNPDRFTSIGLDVSSGKLAGLPKETAVGAPHTDGGFVRGLLDIRVPISNALTVHAFGSSTGVNNNLQYSEGSEVGVGIRVFLQ